MTEEKNNQNYVKIISNQDNEVLYLTRSDSPLAFRSKPKPFQRHQDFITIKPDFITKFKYLKNRNLEKYEGIELLRVIENGFRVGTLQLKKNSFSINTKKDLLKSLILIQNEKLRKLY